MGTTITYKYTFPLLAFISTDCSTTEHVEGTDNPFAGYVDNEYDGAFSKFSFGASFGLYVVVLAVLASLSVLATYCQFSGNDLFVGESTSDLSYQLMSQPHAVNMGPE